MAGYLPLKDDFGRARVSPGGYQSIHAVSNMALPLIRNVVAFNGVSGQHVSVPKISLINDSDFKFECVFVRTDPAVAGRFVFSTYTGNNYGINIYTSGDWGGGGGSISMFSTSLQSISNKSIGVEYKVVVERISGTTTMTVNGLLESTTTTFPPVLYTATDMQIAAKGGAFQFHGKVKGLKVFNPINTLISDYRMNDGWENNPVCVNSAAVLGNSLDKTPYFLAGAGSVIDNKFTVTQTASYGYIGADLVVEPGVTYLVEYDICDISGATVGVQAWDKSNRYSVYSSRQDISNAGKYHLVVKAVGTLLRVGVQQSTAGGSQTSVGGHYIVNIKVKRAGGFGNYIGLTAASWSKETLS